MTKIEGLKKRLEKVSGVGNVWIPPWLADVGSQEEINEWRNLNSCRGPDRYDRILAFVHAMRRKYPTMAMGYEEQMEAGVRELKENVALRRREGITEEMEKDDDQGLLVQEPRKKPLPWNE